MTAELIATDGPLKGVILALGEGVEWIVGRDPQSCQLLLEDPKVARKALIIRLTDDGYSVENLSDASIMVNGRELKQAPLNDGDTLKIGDSVFAFYPAEEFEEVIFGASDEEESRLDAEIDFTGDQPRTQNFERGASGDEEFTDEDLPEEGEGEEFVEEAFGEEAVEEGFVTEPPGKPKAKASEGPAEEGFAKEPPGAAKAKGPEGPLEEGFAKEVAGKPAKAPKGPNEESFSQEKGEDQFNKDEWESEEGEAEDFEAEELAEEGVVKKGEHSQNEPSGEDLISEGSEAEKPQAKETPAEELVSEGADAKESVSKEPAGEELVSEGADAEEPALQGALAEDLVSEGADVDQPLPEEPAGLGEQLSGEGLEAVPPPPSSEDFEKENFSEGNQEEEPLFNAGEETSGMTIDLTPSIRFLLKVIAGPNTGAEFVLDMGKEYLIGTEASSCDIVFHDLSVSREHARLYLSEKGELEIEDLSSRNGVLIDQEQIAGKVPLKPNLVVTLGTSAFFIVDREAPQETIVAPTFEAPREVPEEREEVPEEEEAVVALKEEEPKLLSKPGMSIYVSIVTGLAVLLAIGMISLFHTKELKTPPKDFMVEITEAVQNFPSIKYTYSPNSNRLFLVGHVATAIEKDELFYNLNALTFLKGVDDHIVNDEAVWQEMNILISKQKDFKGVSMHSPRPAVFVIAGYMKNEKQAADLTDWMNTHFNYLSLLENRVVVEEQVIDEVSSQLLHNGFGAVAVTFNTGELTLAGYVGSAQAYEFERLVHAFGQLPGVRQLQNFVVIVAPEQQVIDLNQRYPGRFKVTGYSKHGDVSINVVINGHILMRGDSLEGMTLSSIQPHAVFFEKDGLKYKLEYNK